ncbi:luciferase-like monooxygenase [Haloactinopolyspora alba]|uniref:Luciferase-like monooxygenase n=1 Tax=Haloactinopolyspora alba TaxID=648780 RepID=A0A2P8EB86_9ACTN|nr:LLM class flavin-dependent oxidoreductase [Haloactinopolyspora alba]PSL06734.1 luciferase-like monooxygenase [Haloactinopolyspora alba]
MARAPEFGYFLVPNADDPLLDIAREVERAGLGWVGIQDHPYQRRYVDTFALTSAVLTATSTLRVFPDVACVPLRPPAVLAKTAASLDMLSGGRFELGLGAGAFWDAIEGYGGQRRSPGAALGQLAEAVEVVRRIWSGERGLRFEGEYYHLRGVHSGPPPAHDIGVWLGALGPRALRQTGRLADGWVPSVDEDVLRRLPELNGRVDEGAADAGRDPSAVRRVFNVSGEITDGAGTGFLRGPVSRWADELATLVTDHRADLLVFAGPSMSGPQGGEARTQLRRFAEEVVPATRELLPSSP